jgi:hypothetical protein
VESVKEAANAKSSGSIHFASVRESRDNLFCHNLLPGPPTFQFKERKGRIDWRRIMNTNMDKLTSELDLHELEPLLENLTYASVTEDELSRMGDAYFIKLFKLS